MLRNNIRRKAQLGLDDNSPLDVIATRRKRYNELVGKSNEFLDNWNKTRLATGRFDDQLGGGKLEQQKASRDSAPIITNPSIYGQISYHRGMIPMGAKDTPPEVIANRYMDEVKNYATKTRNRILSPDPYTGGTIKGEYNPIGHTIYYDSGAVNAPSHLLHEQTHASKARPQEAKTAEILKKHGEIKHSYWDSPEGDEPYARLMQVREANKIDPNKVWDKESYKEFKKTATDFNFLNRYSDDAVIEIFNNVADAGNLSNDKYEKRLAAYGKSVKIKNLDIREGGTAIPIAPNMYYMNGRSHDEGGIGIGPNNKNGLEVEGGEVVKVGDKDIKVFSSVPLLRGVSPAQLVMGGANPNKVFKAQEEFKDKNRINDDGTTYEMGGNKVIHINNLPSSFKGQLRNGRYVQIGVPPITNKAKSWNNTFKDHINSLNVEMKDFIMDGINYGKKLLPKPLKKYYSRAINILNSTGVQDINNTAQKITQVQAMIDKKKAGGIYIKPSKRGTFTAAAKKRGMGVQEFASKVLANKEDYSPAMVKKANFARNASRWKKEFGGNMIYEINGNVKNALMSARPKAKYGKEKKINEDTKIGEDGLIYKKDVRGNWRTDGTTYQNSKYYMREQSVQRGGKRSSGEVVKPKAQTQSLPEAVVTAKAPKSKGINLPTLKEDYMTGERRSANRHPIPDFVEEVNKDKKVVNSNASSTPRKGGTKATSSKTNATSKPSLKGADTKYGTPLAEKKESLYMTGIKNGITTPIKAGMEKAKTPASSTGGGTKSKDGRWIGQYKPVTAADWIGLGSNVAGSLASYFMTKNAINKTPQPIKPVLAQAAKLKTRYNIEPQLTEIREAEQMNRATVRRNTQSSNTSLAREQRLLNEARGARNKLYSQKENIETQLINQDRLNRQSINMQNVRAYNEYLNKLTATKMSQNEMRASNINNLISGLTGSVNNILGTIESRRATNNTLRAIAAANPNVDARLIGGFDYYVDPVTKRKYNKNQQYVGTING